MARSMFSLGMLAARAVATAVRSRGFALRSPPVLAATVISLSKRVKALLRCAYASLKPGGLFLLDQSTPANSINNADYFEDEGRAPHFTYLRRSQYDEASRLHTTTFDLSIGGEHFHEQHVQRAYDIGEIRALVLATSFDEVAAYDDFSTAPATEASERIHWVLRRVG